ncbi:MAG: hypothetical protein C5B59_10770 [Bacteroidetes bacterium]|nr:MAG: hypothetical protein C5B59_10770 [Bacteroidota bacterium]
MFHSRQVTASLINRAVVLLILLLTLFSCRITKNVQPNKPFVYRSSIRVIADLPNDEKQDLTIRLQNQLDDSLQARTSNIFFIQKLSNPPVFDTANVTRSTVFMTALLNSLGYYAPLIRDTIITRTVSFRRKPDQKRVTVNFTVIPGKRLTYDSIGIDLQTPELQRLALQVKDQSLIQRGSPYSKQVLSLELGRLVDTFRNNGFFRISREDLYVEHDTVIAALIDPNLDPFKQAELFEKLKAKRENPTINVTIRQRPPRDSTHLIRFYIGNVTVYPDLPSTFDTAFVKTDTNTLRRMTFITRSNKFKLPFVANNLFLRPGRLFRQSNYYRTANRIGQLPAWQYANIDFENSDVADSLLDVTIRMYPAKKQKMNIDLEASRNTNDIVTASNFFGVGVNLGLQNRNAFKQSIQTSTNLRGGVELGSNFIQTTEASISHTIAIPQLIVPRFLIYHEGRLKNYQSLFNVNATYTYRKELFEMKSINGSWGYQWSKARQKETTGNININSTHTFLVRIPNVEYTVLNKRDSFQNILNKNPSLNLAFRTGLVIGSQFVYNSIRQKGNKTNAFRVSAEQSGALLGFITNLDKGDLMRFVKGDVQFTHNINYGKSQLVMNAYAGAGVAYGKQGNAYEQTLPFYKAFFAGGPNSMRAWQVRRLGLGSSKFYNDTPYVDLDRFGDIKLEGNIEYRFLIGTLFGVKFRSAIYTDVGNIWNRAPIDTSAAAQGSDFQLNRFYKEFAVGMGTGLRLDFNYFLIRLDWAYKIKDPQRAQYPDRWFYDLTLGSGQFQLGIGYPF